MSNVDYAALDAAYEDGKATGYDEGYNQGCSEGYDEGYADALADVHSALSEIDYATLSPEEAAGLEHATNVVEALINA